MKITYEFDPYEDREELDIFQCSQEMHTCLWDVTQLIRDYHKYEELPTSDPVEEQFLHLKKLLDNLEGRLSGQGIWS